MKILILDDEDAFRTVLSSDLREQGYEVHTIADKAEGFDWVVDNHPDLIISDIHSPGMNGWQFLGWLKANPSTTKLPFIFLTGSADASTAIDAKSRGAADLVTKPYHPDNIIRVVERVLRENHASLLHPDKALPKEPSGERHVAFAPWRDLTLVLEQALTARGIRIALLPSQGPWLNDFVVDCGGQVELSRFMRPLSEGGLTTDDILHFKRALYSRGLEHGALYSLGPVSPELRRLAGLLGIHVASQEQTQELLSKGIHGAFPEGTPGKRLGTSAEQKTFLDFIEKILAEILAAEGKSFPVITMGGTGEGAVKTVSVRLHVVQPAVLSFRKADNTVLALIPEGQLMESLASLWLESAICPYSTRLSPIAQSCLLLLLSSLPSLDSDGLTVYLRGTMAGHSRRKPLIAILESNSFESRTLAESLQSKGYEVAIFESKLEFLVRANQAAHALPHLIISDIFSPGLDGMEFLRAWKRDVRFQHVPVFILSGNIPKLTKEVQLLGAAAWMSKPCDANELFALVKGAIPGV